MSGHLVKATTRSRYAHSGSGRPLKLQLGDKATPKVAARKGVNASLRCSELERIFRDRYGRSLPDDDAGRADAEIMTHHIAHRQTADRLWLMNDRLDRLAPWLVGEERDALINKVLRQPIRYRASTLGKLLGLTDADRQRLGITTIRPIDVTAEELEERRKMKNTKQHADRRRASGCMSRDEYERTSLTKIAPWKVQGVSRATYYRRQKKADEQPRSHYAEDGLVSRIAYAIVTVSTD